MDEFELRARLEEETVEALRLAEDLAAEVALAPTSRKAAELASAFLQVVTTRNRLRRALIAEVAG